jgi:hypothetical protein
MADAPSTYLRHLPEILRSAPGTPDFIGNYLKIFEALLSGRDDVPAELEVRSLESRIRAIPELLDSSLTPLDAPERRAARRRALPTPPFWTTWRAGWA